MKRLVGIPVILFLFLSELRHCQDKIFISQSKDNYNCLSKKTCDGSIDKPLGSLLEGLESLFKASKDTTLYLMNDIYSFDMNELAEFLLEKNKLVAVFSEEFQGKLRLGLEGYQAPEASEKVRRKIIFNDKSFFSFIFGSMQMKIANVYFDFSILFNIQFSYSSFFKTSQAGSSSLDIIECSFDLGLGRAIAAPSTKIKLFDLDDDISTVSISNSMFKINSKSFVSTLFSARTALENAKTIILFENCLFTGEDEVSTLPLIFQRGTINFKGCAFSRSMFYIRISVENTTAIFKQTNFDFVYTGEENVHADYENFLYANGSSIFLSKCNLNGVSSANQAISSIITFIFAEDSNKLVLEDMVLTDIKMERGFFLKSNNEIALARFTIAGFSRRVFVLGKENTFSLTSGNFMQCNNAKDSIINEKGSIIYSEESNDFTLEDSNFLENRAFLGGLFYLKLLTKSFKIFSCKFDKNIAIQSGSVLYLDSQNQKLYVKNSTFTENSAYKGKGGIFYLNKNNSDILISNCVFMQNKFSIDGSILFANENNFNFDIESSFILENSGLGNGLFHFWSQTKNINIINCILFMNEVKGGGVFYVFQNSTGIFIFNCHFHSNKAYDSGSAFTGYSENEKIYILHCYFYNSLEGNMMENGRFISFGNFKDLTILNTLFMNSMAESGGAILFGDNCQNILIMKCLFSLNMASGYGGSIFLKYYAVDITITESLFSRNTAFHNGGSIYFSYNHTNIKFIQNVFSMNSAFEILGDFSGSGSSGGAIYLSSTNANLLVFACMFRYCTSSSKTGQETGGGAMYIFGEGPNFYILDNVFHSSSSTSFGGVLYFRQNLTNLFMLNCLMIDNFATGGAAAIYIGFKSSNLTFNNNKYLRNYGVYEGGAIYIDSYCLNIDFINEVIQDSEATKRAAVLYVNLMCTSIKFFKVKIKNVLSNSTAALAILNMGSEIYFYYVDIQNVRSYQTGLLVTEVKAKIFFAYSSFRNVTTLNGPVFDLASEGVAVFESSNFHEYKTGVRGQSIFRMVLMKSNLTVNNCYFEQLLDYLVNQLSSDNKMIFTNCILVFSEAYPQNEVFLFDSNNSEVILTGNIFRPKTKEKLGCLIQSRQSFSKISLKDNDISMAHYTILVILLKTSNLILEFKSAKLWSNGESFLKLDSKDYLSLTLNIQQTTFILENIIGHFFEFNAGASLSLQRCQFILSGEIQYSLFHFSQVLIPDSMNTITLEKVIIGMFYSYLNAFSLNNNLISSEHGLIDIFQNFYKIQILNSYIQLGKSLLRFILRVISKFSILSFQTTSIKFNLLNNQSHLIFLENIVNSTIIIENSIFANNKVVFGGLLTINRLDFIDQPINKHGFDSNIRITNSSISNNYAINKGGFIYVNGSERMEEFSDRLMIFLELNLIIDDLSKIQGNKAPFGNFIFFQGKYSPGAKSLNKLLDKLNQGNEKNSFSSDFEYFDVLNSKKTFSKTKKIESSYHLDKIVIDDVKPRSEFYFCLALYDRYNQSMSVDSQTEFKANIGNHSLISAIDISLNLSMVTLGVEFHKGSYCVDKFHFTNKNEYSAMMGNKFRFLMSFDIMKKFFPTLNNISSVPTIIEFEIIECPIASFYNGSACMYCPRNTFQKEKIDSLFRCFTCSDINHYNCYGASYRSPKQNFWRLNNISEVFLRCPYTSCKGDLSFVKNETENYCSSCTLPTSKGKLLIYSYNEYYTALGDCAYGYTGFLCAQCIPGFGSSGNFRCADCNIGMVYVKQIILFIVKLGLFLFTNWKGIQSKIDDTQDKNSKKFIENLSSSYQIKIISIYFNYLSLIRYLPFEIDPSFEEAFSSVTNISPTENFEIFSFECLLKKLNIELKPVFFQTLFMLVFCISTFLLILIAFLKKMKKALAVRLTTVIKKYFKSILLIFLINNIVLILYPFVDIIICINLGDDQYQKLVLLKEFSQDCLNTQHRSFLYILAVPIIIIMGGFIPLYLLSCISKAMTHGKLNDGEFQLNFGYFTFPYKPETAFYEVVAILAKICLIIFREAFLLFVVYNNQTSILLIFLLYLMVQLTLLNYFSPYNPSAYLALQNTDSFSLKISMSNTIIALLWSLLGNQYDTFSSQFILLVYAIVTNALFLLYWGNNYFGLLKEKIRDTKNKFLVLKNKIKEKLNKTNRTIEESRKSENHAKIPAKIKTISDSQKLKKENLRLNLLTKLLLEQIAALESRRLDFDEGEVKAAFIKVTPPQKFKIRNRTSNIIDMRSPQNPLLGEEGLKGEELKESELNLWTLPTSMLRLKSKRARGAKFNDSFIVFKFERSSEETVDLRFSLTDKDKDWMIVSIESSEDKFAYVALKKFSPWRYPPFVQIIDFKLIAKRETHLFQEILNFSDFVEVISFSWADKTDDNKAEKMILSNLLFSDKLDFEICKAQFESRTKSPDIVRTLFGLASIRIPIAEIDQIFLTLQLHKDGNLDVYGEDIDSSLASEAVKVLIKFIRKIS